MEPITHFLTGAVLARAGFNRKAALATATMTLAAEAPDLDVLSSFKGPVFGFDHHRGFTHSFLGLILTSAIVVGCMYVVWRLRGKKTNIPGLPPRWGLLFLYAYIAGLSHIVLDFTNNYGVRPFWPFWEKWYSWDIVFILEPALYVILAAGLVLPAFFSRHKPMPHGRTAARIALACVVLLYVARDHEHRRALQAFTTENFGSTLLRVSAYPYYWTLTRWYVVSETQNFFVSADINSLAGQLDRPSLDFTPKPPETKVTLAAKRSYLGRAYLDWAQYPIVTESSEGKDSVVRFRDLRFDYPKFRGRITLSATVELDDQLHVVREMFGHREQKPPLD